MIAREPPADFDSRREMSVKGCQRETDIADELGLTGHLDRPEPIAIGDEVGLDAIHECIGFGAVQRAQKMLHDNGIGIQARERLAVARPPATQQKAFGINQVHERVDQT